MCQFPFQQDLYPQLKAIFHAGEMFCIPKVFATQNTLRIPYLRHYIFEKHFTDFCDVYDEQYADKYGKFSLGRIIDVGEHFLSCGDYLNGVARIRCTNPECGHDYFRPFSCKGFHLCPSCSQKRTILLAEHLTEEVLLKLSHRQFVFTVPKALRIFFRNNRKLFADISRLIFSIIRDFYKEAAGKDIKTGMVIAHQTFGDMLR